MAEEASAPVDPFALWRDWVSQSERQWNSFLNEAMATDQFSQQLGKFMDVYLNTQKQMNELMGRYFAALNLPTRTDVLSLANRLGDIEARLAAIESGLAAVRPEAAKKTAATGGAAPERARPARTKRPAKAG